VSEPVMSLDLFPTVVAMAKGQLSPARKYYGADLTPLLAGEVTRLPGAGVDGSRELLGYYFGAAISIRSGPWKFLRPGYWDLVDTLYNLQTDPAETTDVYPARPEVAKPLDARLAAIADEISQGAKKPKKGGAAN
jgi:arylsulfatase A-like enzyme